MRGVRSVLFGSRHALRFALTVLCLCSTAGARSEDHRSATEARGAEFSLLTYNVAGLPALLSASEPERNTPVIGDLLNLYDVALVQEDFAYHGALDNRARHPHRSPPLLPGSRVMLGDGLNLFSTTPFHRFMRAAWKACHGRLTHGGDCLTKKGFTVAEHRLASGVSIDIYNVHMDSGGAAADRAARAQQVDQLLAAIESRSAGQPVIVAGDTNMDEHDDSLLSQLLDRAELFDACRALQCRAPKMIDRVMFRGSERVQLRAVRMEIDPRFVGDDGRDLSDHKAVGVVFRWDLAPPKIAKATAPG